MDTVTGGRGLKFWSEPSIRNVKSVKNFHEFRLANGLKVIAKESPGAQINAELIIKAGAVDDPKGEEGQAHFLEHMVLSNTKQFGDKIDDVASYVGATVNAYTTFDRTGYWVNAPKDKLELALRILSDQLAHVELDSDEKAAVAEKEKGIISNEVFMSASSEAGQLYNRILKVLYGADSPLCTNVIGTVNSVKGMSAKNLKKYYEKYYIPNNAELVISGGFNIQELKRMVEAKFGHIKAGPDAPKIDLSKTIKANPIREHTFRDNTLEPSFLQVYNVSKFNHKDSLILQLIGTALCDGKNSRLYKLLIDKKSSELVRSASGISFFPFVDKDRGHIFIQANPLKNSQDPKLYAEFKTVIENEIEKIKTQGLEDSEFKRVLNQVEVSELYKQDKQHSSIDSLVQYEMSGEDWTKYLGRLNDFRAITNTDIKNFAAKYFTDENKFSFNVFSNGNDLDKTFLDVLKEKATGKKGKDAKAEIVNAEKLKELEILAKGPSKLPCELNGVERVKYPNNVDLFFKKDTELPLVFAKINFDGGFLKLDKKKRLYIFLLVHMFNNLGSYNPKTNMRIDKKAVERFAEELGLDLSFGPGLDYETLSFSFSKKHMNKSLALINELLNNPAFLNSDNPKLKEEINTEFERFKQSFLKGIELKQKDNQTKSFIEFTRALFPENHENAALTFAEMKKMASELNLPELISIFKSMKPNNIQATVVGDISKAEIENNLLPIFTNLGNPKASPVKLDEQRVSPVKLLEKPLFKVIQADDNRPESNLMMGNVTDIVLDDQKDFYAAHLANSILGAIPLSSRLGKVLREEKGLVYHVRSSFITNKYGSGLFSINLGSDPKNIKACLAAVYEVINDLFKNGITKEELTLVKNRMKLGSSMHQLNSREKTCMTMSELLYRNKDERFVNNFNAMIDAISVDDVMRAMKRMVKPESFAIVATKPKQAQLELNSSDLVKSKSVAAAA